MPFVTSGAATTISEFAERSTVIFACGYRRRTICAARSTLITLTVITTGTSGVAVRLAALVGKNAPSTKAASAKHVNSLPSKTVVLGNAARFLLNRAGT